MESLASAVVPNWEEEQPEQPLLMNNEYLDIFSGEILEFGDRINRIHRFGDGGPGGAFDDEVGWGFGGFDGRFVGDRVPW